jgi:rubrerythrin
MMGIQFTADEIFEVAEQIERNGARFYRKAAQGCASDESIRGLFLRLADMEDDHLRKFQQMRRSLPDKVRGYENFDPEGEAAQYLQAFAGGHVFDVKEDACDRLTGSETIEEVLHIAIGMEKDSIAFYRGIQEMIPQDQGRETIDGIIREEMEHLAAFGRELATLRS